MNNKCTCRKKQRSEKEKRILLNRINRIYGQLGGIRRMIEEDVYCPDILLQIAAADAALRALSGIMLKEHIKTCVIEDIRAGNESAADELSMLIEKLVK